MSLGNSGAYLALLNWRRELRERWGDSDPTKKKNILGTKLYLTSLGR